MIQKFKFLSVVLISFFSLALSSQQAEFEYWTELCDCKGTYDSTKYSQTKIQNTFDYLWFMPSIETSATAWRLEEIDSLSTAPLIQECNEKISTLKSLDLPNDTFWLDMRNQIIRYFMETCKIRELTILAYSDPNTLNRVSLDSNKCDVYREGLIEGGEKLLNAWTKMNEIQKSKNADPNHIQMQFENEYYSDKPLEYARLRVMMFGWWNCANHNSFHIDTTINFEKEFTRLFEKTECECMEP